MQHRMSRIYLVCCLCLIAIRGIAQERQKTTFDYTTGKDGLVPLVHVILHNGGTGIFAFDTGTNYNVISDTLANTLTLPMGPAENADGSPLLVEGEQAPAALTSVLIGSYLQQDTLFLVIPTSRIQFLGKNVGGFLGWLFMHDCAVLFDFHKHEITLWSPGNLPTKDLKEISMEDAVVFDQITPETSWGTFKVTVRLNDQVNIDLKIDTGSWDTVIPTQVAHQLKLLPTRRKVPYQSAYGVIPSEAVRLDSLVFGPILIRGKEIYYATKENKFGLDHLGLDILSHFRMLIDFSAHKLYLKPEQEDSASPKVREDKRNHKQS